MSRDPGRLTHVIEKESRQLLAYFERRVVVREDAADMVAETLTALWRRVDDLPADDERARMWLYGVARRVLLAQRRKARRLSDVAERLRAELAASAPDDDDLRETVRAAVRALPEKDRELIGLVHWEGFSLVDAARVLGIRPGTARMRYGRARARLRDDLSPESTSGEVPSTWAAPAPSRRSR